VIFFFSLQVPVTLIMLTNSVYRIQLKNRKNSLPSGEFFLLHLFYWKI